MNLLIALANIRHFFWLIFFSRGNQLNAFMQGKQKIFLDVAESIEAFKAKIKLWMHPMEAGKLAAFPALNLFVEEKNIDLRGICPIFLEHLTTFVFELDWYIPSQNYSQIFNWIPAPCEVSALKILYIHKWTALQNS